MANLVLFVSATACCRAKTFMSSTGLASDGEFHIRSSDRLATVGCH